MAKKTKESTKTEKIVELIEKEAIGLFDKAPRGGMIKSKVVELAEEIEKI